MRRDVVGHREELFVHQLLRARDDLIARRVGSGQPRDDRRHVERLLERRHLLEHVARRLLFRSVSVLGVRVEA